MSWIAIALLVVGIAWFLTSWRKWNRKQAGDANELDWLDEVVREHVDGKRDNSELIRRAIQDIERDHDPSPALARDLRRAKDAIGDKSN
jgi:hypothetical protein